MIFVETEVFTERIRKLADEESYAEFQFWLADNPQAGDVIPGTGGIRKVRMGVKGHGKRGGARVIYYHFVADQQIAMLYVYAKNERTDLTTAQRKALKKIVQNWSRG
ncbi:MAG: type II toxin-antitoxin system RelE/ParE family toxin [Gammaproteobacteria bacterium]